MNNKFKSYSFWMSVAGAVILVINNIGKVCGFAIDSEIVTEIVDSVCGVLILFGVITMSKDDDKEINNNSSKDDCIDSQKTDNVNNSVKKNDKDTNK